MSTHKPHLYVEPISSAVFSIIQGLQEWLMEADFEEFTLGFRNRWRRYDVCVSNDRFEKWELITDKIDFDIEVLDFDHGQRKNELIVLGGQYRS
jgi:hypothetical protein